MRTTSSRKTTALDAGLDAPLNASDAPHARAIHSMWTRPPPPWQCGVIDHTFLMLRSGACPFHLCSPIFDGATFADKWEFTFTQLTRNIK